MKYLAFLALVLSFVHVSLQQECSASKECPAGCCSSAGFCGYGPDYCGEGCQSTCERKADCNPGWSSSEFSLKEKCPLNVCCSDHGFCGYTDEFCKNDKVDRPSCSITKEVDRVIGYWESWSTKERYCLSMNPEAIPYGHYTDLIFSFATINPNTFRISAGDWATEKMMTRIGSMKLIQPNLKIWVAIGGWAFNDPGPTETTFSDIASSSTNTEIFLDSLVGMMLKYNFDGVDIDWEYPVAEDRNGRPEDYKNIVTFMKRLSSRMKTLKKKVSMAIPASYWYLQNFDIKALEPTVDWFNVMTYDVHGSWDIDNEWTGPWANSHTNMTEIQMGLDLLWRNDISPSKVTMGMAFYSRSFTLTDAATCNDVGCRIASAGNPGRCSNTAGVLLHPKIAEIVKEEGLSPKFDQDAAVKTVSWGDQWVSFDDIGTWRRKANIARSQCITGFMVWAISHDDENWTNAKALTRALEREIPKFPDFSFVPITPEPAPALAPQLCRWTSCYEDCPNGFKAVQREGHVEVMLDSRLCKHIRWSNHGMSKLCCPATSDNPKCAWRGHRNSGKCKPGCNSGEVELGSLMAGCKKNYQSACCESTPSTEAYGKCYWTPCHDKMGNDWSNSCVGQYNQFIVEADRGSADMPKCKGSKKRAMCCTDPAPAEFAKDNCRWVRKAGHVSHEDYCEGSCPSGSFRIALEDMYDHGDNWCYDVQAYCCDDPKAIKPREVEYEEEAVHGGKAHSEFEYLLDRYLDNPTCPATILVPDIHGTDIAREKRRDLVREAQEYDILHSRATNCVLGDWVTLVAYVVLMFNRAETEYRRPRDYWDSQFATRYGTQLYSSDLRSYFDDYDGIDRQGHMEMVLLSPEEANDSMNNMRDSGEELCVEPIPINVKRDKIIPQDVPQQEPSESVVDVDRRLIFVPGGSQSNSKDQPIAGIPNLNRILEGINDGDLTLHYARYQWYNGSSVSRASPGPMLEIAYWIGPQIGQSTVANSHYDIYRDTRRGTNDPNPDHWVVFHIHYDTSRTDWLRRFADGNTYPSTSHISVFHGQRWQAGRGAWRVNGRLISEGNQLAAPAAHRAGWHCPRGRYWYIGSTATPVRRFSTLLRNWGRNLFANHYVNVEGLRMIIEPPQNTNGADLDPYNMGTIVGRRGSSTRANGMNPYNVNFRITINPNTGAAVFTFNIPRPDASLQ